MLASVVCSLEINCLFIIFFKAILFTTFIAMIGLIDVHLFILIFVRGL